MKQLTFLYFLFVLLACKALAGQLKITDQVFFDVAIDGEEVGRITIGLFGEDVPKTVRNFKQIATEGIDGLTYAGTKFHRVITRFMIQGGDIVHNDGTGSISIYGDTFEDENFNINHTTAGFVSMANFGPDSNGCQFFITTMSTRWLDGKHVVVGYVLNGQGLVHKIEHLKTDITDRPFKTVSIVKSGLIPTPKPFFISDHPNEVSFRAWIEAGIVPLTFSLAIMAFFHYFMRRLDNYKLAQD